MRVISQDGTIDIPYDSVIIQRFGREIYFLNKNLIGVEQIVSDMDIATYSTEEKARKAMEELRYAYMCHSLAKMGNTPTDGIDEKLTMGLSGVFQFPTEEELKQGMEVLSFLDAVQRDMADNIYNFCKDGKCSQCGNCCSNLLPMSQKEIDVIRRYIRKKHIKECRHIAPATVAYDMTCPFLDTGKSCEKCRIYPVRPEICKQFICDNEQRAKYNRKLLGQTRDIVDVREEFFGK